MHTIKEHKEQWAMYNQGKHTCPNARMLRDHGLFCPWFKACVRIDRKGYFECRRKR